MSPNGMAGLARDPSTFGNGFNRPGDNTAMGGGFSRPGESFGNGFARPGEIYRGNGIKLHGGYNVHAHGKKARNIAKYGRAAVLASKKMWHTPNGQRLIQKEMAKRIQPTQDEVNPEMMDKWLLKASTIYNQLKNISSNKEFMKNAKDLVNDYAAQVSYGNPSLRKLMYDTVLHNIQEHRADNAVPLDVSGQFDKLATNVAGQKRAADDEMKEEMSEDYSNKVARSNGRGINDEQDWASFK
jgi:hypothetical protein